MTSTNAFDKIDDELSYHTNLKFNNYVLKWRIENFDLICQSVETIESPKFPSKHLENVQWFLKIKPTEIEDGNKKEFVIVTHNTDGRNRFISMKISFCDSSEKIFQNFITGGNIKRDHNLTWSKSGSDLFKTFNNSVPKVILVICKLSVFKSATSIIEKQLIDSSKFHNLSENIENLYENKDFIDVIFKIGRHKFTAHKAILALRSSIFAGMFKNKKNEELTSIIKIIDVTPGIFEKLLRFIYTDRVENLKENSFELFTAANKYKLEKLKTMCINCLNKNINSETILSTLKFADLNSISKLKNKCLERLNNDLKFVKDTKEFLELVQKLPDLNDEIKKNLRAINSGEKKNDDESNDKLNLTFRV
ncbi:protein roadkill-like [Leptopilina boulardi]|uniref:protein roadkill-like n=1 Tax=Leptopilina boulardi TaxID=63433 RepID=UPI0021F649D8|nr:protein roadkill-like [Leptopilina boulardi]